MKFLMNAFPNKHYVELWYYYKVQSLICLWYPSVFVDESINQSIYTKIYVKIALAVIVYIKEINELMLILNKVNNVGWWWCPLSVFVLIFSPTCPKTKYRKNYIYSKKFCHNFHLSESSFTCPGLWASGLAWRL
jgi:hypothetical protein